MFQFKFCEFHVNNNKVYITQQPKLFKGTELQSNIATYAGYSLSELSELPSGVTFGF